nr:EAL domain-containing protein [Jeotgalibaca sp. MA1X17-3]
MEKLGREGQTPGKIAVNFSVYQLEHPHIIKQIEDVLKETLMSPKYLEVEVTESVLAVSNQKSKEVFKQLKKMGILLSIDDFGKEYSSLSRLKELPVDTVKIDMSFVQDIGKNVKGESIVKAIISLASDLGLETIAEGVETKEQLEFLTNRMCTLFQGYYFYKPMPAHEIEKILLKESNTTHFL